MVRAGNSATLFLLAACVSTTAQTKTPPSFDYELAQIHELKPHRRAIPTEGVRPGFNQLRLTLKVSAAGDVMDATASGGSDAMTHWQEIRDEVSQWRFTPFEVSGYPTIAEVEEYVDLVPPERLPTSTFLHPPVRRNSTVIIKLERSGCFGTCPGYSVRVSTRGVLFEGRSFVVAAGKHPDGVDAKEVRELAKRFVAADFYSMDARYAAGVTDSPTFSLSISIDGHSKQVEDYVGPRVGMPAVISDLEQEVDDFAGTQRWITGAEGLVDALQAEDFDFHSFEAQVVLKEAAARGQADTIRELLDAGVPLDPLPAPKPKNKYDVVPFANVGWLNAASNHPEVLAALINAGASRTDQNDKDLALVGAARSGNLAAVQAMISYGADPNADLTKLTITQNSGGMTSQSEGAGTILIFAAESGNPDVVREILSFHPNLEAGDRMGRTALFAAGEYRGQEKEGARVACVRLLAEAGANVNARQDDGNTPLHETFLTDVENELLKLGADVNARNNDGETPIFTTFDNAAIPLFIQHGADLSIRNKKGETVLEAAKDKGPQRVEALQDAIAQQSRP